jgi:hypothetical protein
MIKQIFYCALTIILTILLSILLVKSIDLFMINIIKVSFSIRIMEALYSGFIMIGFALSILILGQKNRFFED